MLKLHKITRDRPRDRFNDTDDADERQPEETTRVMINPAAIRCFYPRKENRVGTRITFTDGGGFAVAETFDMVETAIESLLGRAAIDVAPEPAATTA